jgi:hypothetical protein
MGLENKIAIVTGEAPGSARHSAASWRTAAPQAQ